MPTIIRVSDIVDPDDAAGRTYRQVNDAKTHTIPVGALVEHTKHRWRLWVVQHARDCDRTPLYELCANKEHTEQHKEGFRNNDWIGGYPEESLRAIEDVPDWVPPTDKPEAIMLYKMNKEGRATRPYELVVGDRLFANELLVESPAGGAVCAILTVTKVEKNNAEADYGGFCWFLNRVDSAELGPYWAANRGARIPYYAASVLGEAIKKMPIENEFAVGVQGRDFVLGRPPRPWERISPERALQLAAWILTVSMVDRETWQDLCRRVAD